MPDLPGPSKQEQAFALRLQRLKPILALFAVINTMVGGAALFVDGLFSFDNLGALFLVFIGLVFALVFYYIPWEKINPAGLPALGCTLLGVWAGATVLSGGAKSPLYPFVFIISVFFGGLTIGWVQKSLTIISCLAVYGIWLLGPDSSGLGTVLVLLTSLIFTGTYTQVLLSYHDEEFSQRQHLSSLLEVSRVATNLNLEQTLTDITETVKRWIGADGCVIYLLESGQNALLPQVVNLSNDPTKELEIQYRLYRPRIGEGLVGLVGSVPVPLMIPDASADFRAAVLPGLGRDRASVIVTPMTISSRATGVILLYRLPPGQFTEDDLQLATVFANEAAIAVANARLFAETTRLTITDSLTGTYNARYLKERLGEEILRARRYGYKLALALIDSDSLKMVNDRFGHQEGDHLLKELTNTTWRNIRSTDILFRYAGDEFVILLPETSLDEAVPVLDRVRQAVADQVFTADGENHRVTVSIGVASFPDQAVGAEDLIRKADVAMYRAKAQGKDRVVTWSASDEDPPLGSTAI